MEAADPFAHVWARIATGNPAWAHLGIRLLELQSGRASLELAYRPEISNSFGSVHGGIVSALADAAGGCALYTLLPAGSRIATVEFKVNFLRPVTADARAEARAVHQGARNGVSYVEVASAGEPAAVALITFAFGV